MSSSVSKALHVPEILQEIAFWMPLFEYGLSSGLPEFKHYSTYSWFDFENTYAPHNLARCLLVSRLWNRCFTSQLYQYYVHQANISPRSYKQKRRAFDRHFHLIRWVANDYKHGEKNPPYSPRVKLGNLEGLFLYTTWPDLPTLLVSTQGPELKQLLLTGYGLFENPEVHQNALMSLSCLEELTLSKCLVSNRLLFGILTGCAKTLKKLNIESIRGFDKGLFEMHGDGISRDNNTNNSIIGGTTGKPRWTLPHLKSLSMGPNYAEGSEMTALLPRLFPALESINIIIHEDVDQIAELISTLREYCNNLNSIGYGPTPWDEFCLAVFPEPKIYGSLFKDSFATARLQCASVLVSNVLDEQILDALLFHATTLVKLELLYHCFITRLEEGWGIDKVAILLSECERLKDVRLVNCWRKPGALKQLFARPWRCQELETLMITGYETLDRYVEDQQYKMPKYDPLKPRRHQFCDDGQGWFLKPGLDAKAFYGGNCGRRLEAVAF